MNRALAALAVLGFSFWRAADAYAAVIAAGGSDHQTADWLISYAGGFVRRGLAGELLWALGGSGPAALWTLYGVQVAGWAVVVAYGVHYLVRARFSWTSIALVCGPASLCFVGWDPVGAFRKEVAVFVALALLGWARVLRPRRGLGAVLTGAALVVYAGAVFSWEASALLLPAVLWMVLAPERGTADVPGRGGVGVAFLAISVLGLATSVAAHGDAETAAASCRAIRDRGIDTPGLCDGAIRWLALDTSASLRAVQAHWPGLLAFVPLLILGLLPLLTTSWVRRYWAWAAAAGLLVLPLYAVALDYGRWTHMLVVALMTCVAASENGRDDSPQWTAVGAAVYVAAWGIPHSLAPGDPPWLGLLQTVGSVVLARSTGGS